jgi:acylaminoacyl-peptidase
LADIAHGIAARLFLVLSSDSHSRTVFFVSNRVSGETNGVGGLSQIFQVTLPTTNVASSSTPSPLEVPIFAASSDATTAAANRRAFQRRLGANTPTDPSEESEVPHPSLNGKTSLPTADEASYTEPTLVLSTAMSVDNLLVGRNAQSKRSIIAFSARVFPNSNMSETASRIAAKQARSGSSHVFDKLFVRHWDEWMDGTRNHIHFVAVDQNDKGGVSRVSAPVDLMFGLDSDAPTRPDGDAHSEWSFSVTAKNFAFVRQTWDAYSNVSWTDNTDVYTVRIDPATFAADAPAFDASSVSAPECRTCDNIAIDTAPVYSPTEEDVFVYVATDVPGYESARRSVRAFFTPSISTDLTPTWSYSVSSMVWTSSGRTIYFSSRVQGRQEIILFDVATRSNVSVLAKQGTNDNVQVSPDDSFVLFTTSSYMAPQTIKSMQFSNTSAATVTDIAAGFNEVALSKMVRSPMERFTFAGALDEEVQGFLFRPANYDASKTYPLAFLIHGGPQSAWTEAWSYRWNPQVWASAGYFTVMINFQSEQQNKQTGLRCNCAYTLCPRC